MKQKAPFIILVLFCLPFCAVGVVTGALAAREALSPAPDWARAGFLCVFALTFCIAGFGILALARAGAGRQRRIEALRASNPDTPWRWREDWASGRSEATTRGPGIAFAWGFAILWSLISGFPVALLPAEIRKGNTIAAVGLLFPLVGIGLLVRAVRQTLAWRKFGVSVFEMAGVPVVPGRRLTGAIRANLPLRDEGGFHLRLTCVRRTLSGTGQNRSESETIVWRDERTMTRPLPADDPDRTSIPVSFIVPPDAPPTSLDDPTDQILWILDATAKIPGLDYQAEFELPVFATGARPLESSSIARGAGAAPAFAAAPIAGSTSAPIAGSAAALALSDPGPDEMAEYEAPEDSGRPGPGSGIAIRTSPGGGTEIYFAAMRNPGAAFGLTLFLVLWTGALWLQIHLNVPLIFPIATGAFELLFLAVAADLWFGTTRVLIEADRIEIAGRILGIGTTRILPCSSLQEVRIRIGMQSGGRSGTPYYNIQVVDRDGRARTCGAYIRDKRVAEWIAEEVRRLAKA